MAYVGFVLRSTDVGLVGYFVSVGLWPCWFLVSVLHGVSASEDGEGKKWALPLQQVMLLFAAGSLPVTQPGSCLLQPSPDDTGSTWAVKWHFFILPVDPLPPTTFSSCARMTVPNFGKFGHSHSPIRPFSGAPCSRWDLNIGKKKKIDTKPKWGSPFHHWILHLPGYFVPGTF